MLNVLWNDMGVSSMDEIALKLANTGLQDVQMCNPSIVWWWGIPNLQTHAILYFIKQVILFEW